jgi:TolB-like protein
MINRMLTMHGLVAFFVIVLAPEGLTQDLRTGIDQLANQIAETMQDGRNLQLAVTDFPDLQGAISDFGRYIASRLTTRLAQNPKIHVIERQRLGQVINELKLSMSDLVDPVKAKQLGRMAGVEALVVGTIADMGNQVDIDARTIDIESNRMLHGFTATISKDPTVSKMLENGRQTNAISSNPTSDYSDNTASKNAASANSSPFHFRSKDFSLDLVGVDINYDQIKLRFIFTNLTGQKLSASYDNLYVIDNLGNRYECAKAFSLCCAWSYEFAPKIPEQIWFIFNKMDINARSLSFLIDWRAGGMDKTSIIMRGIQLGQK